MRHIEAHDSYGRTVCSGPHHEVAHCAAEAIRSEVREGKDVAGGAVMGDERAVYGAVCVNLATSIDDTPFAAAAADAAAAASVEDIIPCGIVYTSTAASAAFPRECLPRGPAEAVTTALAPSPCQHPH
jgi:hypothetical protein